MARARRKDDESPEAGCAAVIFFVVAGLVVAVILWFGASADNKRLADAIESEHWNEATGGLRNFSYAGPGPRCGCRKCIGVARGEEVDRTVCTCGAANVRYRFESNVTYDIFVAGTLVRTNRDDDEWCGGAEKAHDAPWCDPRVKGDVCRHRLCGPPPCIGVAWCAGAPWHDGRVLCAGRVLFEPPDELLAHYRSRASLFLILAVVSSLGAAWGTAFCMSCFLGEEGRSRMLSAPPGSSAPTSILGFKSLSTFVRRPARPPRSWQVPSSASAALSVSRRP